MKFLCMSCDEPMKLIEAKPPERGSLTVVYRDTAIVTTRLATKPIIAGLR